jgi:endoglucanase
MLSTDRSSGASRMTRYVTFCVIMAMIATLSPGVAAAVAESTPALSISVHGNHLVNGSGQKVQLRGVNRDGTEYACVQGWGIFDGPSDAASVKAIASWHANAVRIPMNEDCWLGINGVDSQYGGAAYQTAIENYVSLLNKHGLYAILDLAVVDPGTTLATGEQPMPDEDHSPAFWTSVATAFKSDPAALFDLYNEPYPEDNSDTPAAWECWEMGSAGGTCTDESYQVAGMQELVNTVRQTGATNVIMLGGIGYSSVLDDWSAYAPTDPSGQLTASFHNYTYGGCTTSTCWSANLTDIGKVPLITDEFGVTASYTKSYAKWADSAGVSYLAWTWDVWQGGCESSSSTAGGRVEAAACTCENDESLISDYDGAPCAGHGVVYKKHLEAVYEQTSGTG